MARGERRDADYFPFYCKEGTNTKYIESTYGNDGFAVWVKILRQLATTSYHYLDLSKRPQLMTLTSTCKVSEELLLKVIADLVDLGEFDADLWRKDQIIWSDKFIESIQDAYKNRKNKIIKREEFILIAESLTGKKLISAGITSVSYPQTKEEKSKEEETKEEESNARDPMDEKNDLLVNAVCELFEVKKITVSPKYNLVCEFVDCVSNRGEIDTASNALEKYKAYKARSQEQKHGVKTWLGTKENHFRDGEWLATDWDLKLKNYDRNSNKQHQGTSTAAGTTIESGREFGDIRAHRAKRNGSTQSP